MHIVRSVASTEDSTISAIGNIGGIGALLGSVSSGARAAGAGSASGLVRLLTRIESNAVFWRPGLAHELRQILPEKCVSIEVEGDA